VAYFWNPGKAERLNRHTSTAAFQFCQSLTEIICFSILLLDTCHLPCCSFGEPNRDLQSVVISNLLHQIVDVIFWC
jgi:hypothetical protein